LPYLAYMPNISYIYSIWKNTSILKNRGMKIGKEQYSMGELAQLARRRMIQKDHGDQNKYNRKLKHKNKSYE